MLLKNDRLTVLISVDIIRVLYRNRRRTCETLSPNGVCLISLFMSCLNILKAPNILAQIWKFEDDIPEETKQED